MAPAAKARFPRTTVTMMMKRPIPPLPSEPAPPSEGVPAPATGRRSRRRRRRIVVTLLAVVLVLVLAVGGTAVALILRLSDSLATNAVSRPGGEQDGQSIPDWDGPVNLLIMGSDGRDGLTSGTYGGDDVEGDRSDTLMLLHVNAAHTDATLVSIPRDTMLPRPACRSSNGTTYEATDATQVNSAFDIGPYCTLDTIRAYTGLDIDNFVVVNFDGFIDITNAIGGVDVCLAEDVDDPDSGLRLSAGKHTIQGEEALAFVRTRYGIGDGSDLGRIRTQQTYLSALARKVKSAQTLTNPVALFSLADAAGRTLKVNKALSRPEALVGLAGTLARVSLDRMVLLQLPVQDYVPDPNRVEPIPDQAKQLFDALREDRPVSLSPAPADSGSEAVSPSPDEGAASPASGAPGVTLPPDVKGQTADRNTCAGG